jgi:photosystem II stability/assembly factor-like uncharacterized protein
MAWQRPPETRRPEPAKPADPAARPQFVAAVKDPIAAAIDGLKWRSIGPANNAGRIPAIAGVPGDPSTYYVGGAAGGIAKTTNGGVTFRQIFDKQSVASIGAIVVAPSDPHIVYVGSGEGNPRNSASVGDGMYKSVDGGDHWTKIGLEKTDKITRVIVDAKNPDLVWACGIGRTWGANEERGVFKTTDGGKSWRKVLYIDPQTACSDIASDPNNSNIMYAGMYTYRRWAWYLNSGGGNTAVYKSVDGGETWERLSGKDRDRGLPKGDMDRIGIAVAPSDPDIVYVISETKTEGELWRSDDAGRSWRMVNADPNINFRPFYYADIRVDPIDPNRVYTLSGSLYLSEDGGRNFRTIANGVHGDHQSMWIDPKNPKRILEGSDGGWQVSYDRGRSWEVVNTVAFTQFYHINYDMQKPYMVCGGLQDNGNWCGPSIGLSGSVTKADWYTVSGGDGFWTVPDIDRPWLVYSDAQGGMINLTDIRTGTQKMIYPYPNRVGSVGDAMESHKYRFNWNSPIAISPQNPAVVYFGGNVVFKSTNHGESWTVISPDLTTNDKNKQKSSGGEIVTDNTAAEFHTTIISIAPSPLDSNVIWVGTDDGKVQVTRDGGKTWEDVFKNAVGAKPFSWFGTVDASHFDKGTAYAAAAQWQNDDYAPYFWMTTDFGKTWKAIHGDMPATAGWPHAIREDPKNRNLLYAGTEMGVWASWDRGTHWVSLRGELAAVPVRDIRIHPRENDLIIATHGRGMFIMDDISALQNLQPAMQATAPATLFDVRPAIRWNFWNKDGNLGQKIWRGQNPPEGALITYYLKTQPEHQVDVQIADASGRVVRRYTRVPDEAGVNRINWDLRMDAGSGGGRGGRGGGRGGAAAGGAAGDTSLAALRARRRAAAEQADDGGGEENFFGPGGIAVLPGTYQVTLVVEGQRYTKPVTVSLDPRSDQTAASLNAQYTAAVAAQAEVDRVNRTITALDDLSRQLTALQANLRAVQDTAAGPANRRQVLTEVAGALADLKVFRDSVLARPINGLGYRQYPRLREEAQSVQGMIARPMMGPTAGELLRTGEIKTENDAAQTRLDGIVQNRVLKINEMLKGSSHIITPPPRIIP